MKAILLPIVLTALAAILLLPIAERSIYAQAPSGPQGGSPPPQSAPPKPALAAPSQQQAPQSGVTIAVDVPVVTLDVIAATKNGDILTGRSEEHTSELQSPSYL